MKVLLDIDIGGQQLTKKQLKSVLRKALASKSIALVDCNAVIQAKCGFRGTLFNTDDHGKLAEGNTGVRNYKTISMAKKHGTNRNIVELYALKVGERGN